LVVPFPSWPVRNRLHHVSQAFRRLRLWPTVFFVLFALASFWLLNKALHDVPLGTAHAVWTGIGAFGTAVVGVLMFADPVSGVCSSSPC
jgi:quaternary ammonium compound-resistance protein SugE